MLLHMCDNIVLFFISNYMFVKTCNEVQPLRKQKPFCIICKIFCMNEYSSNPDTDAATGGFNVVLHLFNSLLFLSPKEIDAKSIKYFSFSAFTLQPPADYRNIKSWKQSTYTDQKGL